LLIKKKGENTVTKSNQSRKNKGRPDLVKNAQRHISKVMKLAVGNTVFLGFGLECIKGENEWNK